jgi:lipopolysaccharide export system protein LptA
MLKAFRLTVVLAACAMSSTMGLAQTANVAFGGLKQDTSLPVEVTADQLNVNQADGTAIFTGNVLVGQGEMRLSAERVKVDYTEDRSAIAKLYASGGVTLVNTTDAAESRDAVYTIDSGNVVMTGDVLLTQPGNAMSGQKLVINLKDGTGVMEGRVQTVFQPNKAKN